MMSASGLGCVQTEKVKQRLESSSPTGGRSVKRLEGSDKGHNQKIANR